MSGGNSGGDGGGGDACGGVSGVAISSFLRLTVK